MVKRTLIALRRAVTWRRPAAIIRTAAHVKLGVGVGSCGLGVDQWGREPDIGDSGRDCTPDRAACVVWDRSTRNIPLQRFEPHTWTTYRATQGVEDEGRGRRSDDECRKHCQPEQHKW